VFNVMNRFSALASAGAMVTLIVAGSAVSATAPVAATSSPPWSACTSGLNITSSPRQPYPDGAILYAVSAPSATDAWAVGELTGPSLSLPQAEHWNGSTWTVTSIDLPALDGAADSLSSFDAVAAFSPTDAWAGGFQDEPSGEYPVLAHWNGTTWTLRTFPTPASHVSVQALAGTGGGDLWVGEQTGDQTDYLAHYDGTSWTLQQSPLAIQSLTALGPDQVAVGGEQNGDDAAIADYVGGNWSVIADPGSSEVTDISGNQPDDLWAVGAPESPYTNWTLLHYTASGWTDLTGAIAGIVVTSNGAGDAAGVMNNFGATPAAFKFSDPNGPIWGPYSQTNLAWDPSYGTELDIHAIAATPRGALFAVGSLRENGIPDIQEPIVFRDCPG
jgi:hypothetical protein